MHKNESFKIVKTIDTVRNKETSRQEIEKTTETEKLRKQQSKH